MLVAIVEPCFRFGRGTAGPPPIAEEVDPMATVDREIRDGARGAGRSLFAVAALSVAFNPLNATMVAVALPALQVEFASAPETLTLWLVNGFLVVTIVCLAPAGKIADKIGLWRALGIGQGVFCLGTVLAIVAPTFEIVVAGRLFMAVGTAILHPTGMALIRNHVPATRRPRAFGTLATATATAAVVGPALAGYLTEAWGWRAIFLVNIPVLALAWLFARNARRGIGGAAEGSAVRGRFDWMGTLLLTATLVLLIGGLNAGGITALELLAGGLAVATAFIWWERRVDDPVLDPGFFANRTFSLAIAILTLQFFSMFGFLFHAPFMFTAVSGFGALEVGIALMVFSVGVGVCAPFAGRCAERLGSRPVIVAGALTASIGVLLLGIETLWTSLPWIAACYVVAGIGYGASLGPSQAAALSTVGPGQSGAGAAALSMMRYIGSVLGIATLGILLGDAPAEAGLETHRIGTWIYGGAFLLSAVVAVGLRDRRRASGRAPGGSP
jgi:MFS family permease